MSRIAVIVVSTTIAASELHAYDQAVVGSYAVRLDGPESASDDEEVLVETAKDVFHDHIGIHVLDDFDIAVSIMPQGEKPEHTSLHWL